MARPRFDCISSPGLCIFCFYFHFRRTELIPDDLSLILASSSPRRKALLRQIGLDFSIHPSHVDETLDPSIPPHEHVTILAERKAGDIAKFYDDALVVGADTIVVLDGAIITKPVSKDDAVDKLTTLSGRKHEVYTGFTIQAANTPYAITQYERTEVWFRNLDRQEIVEYVASGSPMDKAGAYGIQDDFGAVFIERINGDYYNVVGLPLCRFYLALKHITDQMTRKDGIEA